MNPPFGGRADRSRGRRRRRRACKSMEKRACVCLILIAVLCPPIRLSAGPRRDRAGQSGGSGVGNAESGRVLAAPRSSHSGKRRAPVARLPRHSTSHQLLVATAGAAEAATAATSGAHELAAAAGDAWWSARIDASTSYGGGTFVVVRPPLHPTFTGGR